jgi:hypothetical protein
MSTHKRLELVLRLACHTNLDSARLRNIARSIASPDRCAWMKGSP